MKPSNPMPPRIQPRDFSHLLGHVTGITDRSLQAHFGLYVEAVEQLNALEAQYPKLEWGKPPGASVGIGDIELRRLMATPIGRLDLKIEGELEDCIDELREELNARGVTWMPTIYLGDADFWTTDRATSINVPWFLANPTLWALVNDQTMRYSRDDLLRTLRHETGHALGYAFELWKRPDWRETFGDFTQPYQDAYDPDPQSRDFVRHLHHGAPNQNSHYAQKHPDEDWAETFAVWLDPGSHWKRQYRDWPGALAKLQFVDRLITSIGAAYAAPTVIDLGQQAPYTELGQTVGEYLGETKPSGAWSQHSELLRRDPHLRNEVVLHELYFEQLAGQRPPSDDLRAAIAAAFDDWESFLLDLRAICGSTEGWALACWDPWAGRVRNALVEGCASGILADCPVLLAIDLGEHAYMMDYATRKDVYLAAVFRNMDWARVSERFRRAVGGAPGMSNGAN